MTLSLLSIVLGFALIWAGVLIGLRRGRASMHDPHICDCPYCDHRQIDERWPSNV